MAVSKEMSGQVVRWSHSLCPRTRAFVRTTPASPGSSVVAQVLSKPDKQEGCHAGIKDDLVHPLVPLSATERDSLEKIWMGGHLSSTLRTESGTSMPNATIKTPASGCLKLTKPCPPRPCKAAFQSRTSSSTCILTLTTTSRWESKTLGRMTYMHHVRYLSGGVPNPVSSRLESNVRQRYCAVTEHVSRSGRVHKTGKGIRT